MLIDCNSCTARGPACSDCLVTVLFDPPAGLDQLGAAEHRAVEIFTRAGFEVEVLAPPAPAAAPRQRATRRRPGRRLVA